MSTVTAETFYDDYIRAGTNTETVEVPFRVLDNRRCLTDEQLLAQPWLRGFVSRFTACFEYDLLRCVWWFND